MSRLSAWTLVMPLLTSAKELHFNNSDDWRRQNVFSKEHKSFHIEAERSSPWSKEQQLAQKGIKIRCELAPVS